MIDARFLDRWLRFAHQTELDCPSCANTFGKIAFTLGVTVAYEFDFETLDYAITVRPVAQPHAHRCSLTGREAAHLFAQAQAWADAEYARTFGTVA